MLRGIALGERLVRRARLIPDTCLYRSFARYAELRRAGVPADLVMGLRTRDGAVEGHAWLEIEGAPFLETVDANLVESFRYPAPGAVSS